MQAKFLVHGEVHNRWPARNGKPAGESYLLNLIDMSEPAEDALRSMYQYRLNDEEKTQYWGQSARKTLTIGVHNIMTMDGKAILVGRIVPQAEAAKSK